MGRIRFRHRFIRGIRKERCPSCGHYTLSPYINIDTGQPFEGNRFGKCDRLNKCRYHEYPTVEDYRRLGFDDEPEDFKPSVHPKVKQLMDEEFDHIFEPLDNALVFKAIGLGVENTSLFKFLSTKFDKFEVLRVMNRYMVGYSKSWKGSPVFFLIDISGEVRTGKIMAYDEQTGKRIKSPYNHVSWMHTKDKKAELPAEDPYSLKQCLFGEFLIPRFTKFNIVESEKSAIIATLASSNKPNELWLSVGGLGNIHNSLFRVLEGREVMFYPDKGKAYNDWVDKVNRLSPDIRENFKVSKCLQNLSYLNEGDDIADYILQKL